MRTEEVLFGLEEGVEPWPNLAGRLGISPEELRAILLALRGQGFPVLVEEEGAGLPPGTPAPQVLLPRLRGKLGRPYRYLGTTTTTQDVLRKWWEAPPGALVLAEQQTHGRGRLGRPWQSPAGNLYFSLLLPEVDPLLPFRAGLALSDAAGVGSLKWPNDLLAPDGQKIAGILVEREKSRVILGVGINVERGPIPGSAALAEFRPVHRAQLLADFLWHLEQWLWVNANDVLLAWKARNITIGRRVAVQLGTQVFEGEALDLGPQGELILRTSAGLRKIQAGEVGLL